MRDETSVAPIVPRPDASRGKERLGHLERVLQPGGVVQVRRVVSELLEDLGQRGAPQALPPGAQVHEQQSGVPGSLEVRRHDLADVGAGRVGRDDERAGGLHGLVAALAIRRQGRHREAVLPAVDCDAELDHHVAHRLRRVVQRGPLPGELRRPHPVGRAPDVSQAAQPGPDDVRERLADGHAGHGPGVHEPLHRLLADRGGGSRRVEVALRDHGDVGDGELQRPAALLPSDQPRHASVHLGREEALGTHRDEAEHALQRAAHVQAVGKAKRLEPGRDATGLERLLGHVAQDVGQLQVHGMRAVPAIVHADAAVPRHGADERERDLLPLAEGAKEVGVLGLEQERVVLLILGTPDLEYGERVVTDEHVADLDDGTLGLDDLLEDVAVSSRALVVDAHDRVGVAQLHARADHAVDLLFHLRVAALHGVEVQLRDVLALQHAGCRAAAHADPIRRPADLRHQHGGGRLVLDAVGVVDLADATREHDGLEPLAALAVW